MDSASSSTRRTTNKTAQVCVTHFVLETQQRKLKICELAKGGRTLQSLANEFDIGKSTVHDIVKNEERLQVFQKEVTDGDCMKKRKTMKKSVLTELDKAVYLWFIQQRCKGQ